VQGFGASDLHRSMLAGVSLHIGGLRCCCHCTQAVYEYWAAKRRRTAKPLLKRLQAPTNPNDTNPYNVFR
jgi:hypothetical protein